MFFHFSLRQFVLESWRIRPYLFRNVYIRNSPQRWLCVWHIEGADSLSLWSRYPGVPKPCSLYHSSLWLFLEKEKRCPHIGGSLTVAAVTQHSACISFIKEETMFFWGYVLDRRTTFPFGRSQEMRRVTRPSQGGVSADGRAPRPDSRLEMVHRLHWLTGKTLSIIPFLLQFICHSQSGSSTHLHRVGMCFLPCAWKGRMPSHWKTRVTSSPLIYPWMKMTVLITPAQ